MPNYAIEVKNLHKCFGSQIIHEDLNLTINQGETVSIVGGSGTGKSVLLRQLLHLERPDRGIIRILGAAWADIDSEMRLNLLRRIGMQFQQGALFSALSVLDNIILPLNELGGIHKTIIERAAYLKLDMVGLPRSAAHKLPADLSGGMVKRAALARALALDPELLFLDEPTAGLDPLASEEYVQLMKNLRTDLNLTVVMVTHDLDSLVALSDRVAVLAERRVLAIAPIPDILKIDHPFISSYFLGTRGQRALQARPQG
jgi:phospholipid/cholesterol/gamma-HCH transport system ATP-binding protein